MSCESHPDEDLFDALYPPATDLPKSDEYTDESQAGMYGRSEHDMRILRGIDPLHVWSITEEDGCLFASPAFRVVNWMYYYVSGNQRAIDGYDRDYQLTIDYDDDEVDE